MKLLTDLTGWALTRHNQVRVAAIISLALILWSVNSQAIVAHSDRA